MAENFIRSRRTESLLNEFIRFLANAELRNKLARGFAADSARLVPSKIWSK